MRGPAFSGTKRPSPELPVTLGATKWGRTVSTIAWTSVLNAALMAEEKATVLAASTRFASPSVASTRGSIARFRGDVTLSPTQSAPTPAMKVASSSVSTLYLRYSQSRPSSPNAVSCRIGDNECSIGDPMTPAHRFIVSQHLPSFCSHHWVSNSMLLVCSASVELNSVSPVSRFTVTK